MEFVIGGMAGALSVVFTNPLDVMKTRMQLQGEMRALGEYAPAYRGVAHAAITIVKNDGIRALQKGFAPAVIFQIMLNSNRLGLYQIAESKGLTRNREGNSDIRKSVFYSSASGVASAVFASPAYLIKIQMQSASSIAVGHQHHHKGVLHALTTIYKKNGIKGLYKGVGSSILRVGVGGAVQLTTFSRFKDVLRNNNVFVESPILQAFLASALSGVILAVAMSPFDVVSTRLYNQGSNSNGKGALYNGVLDCVAKTYKTERVLGFYKGVGPLYLRIAPHTVLTLVFWEKLKLLNELYNTQTFS